MQQFTQIKDGYTLEMHFKELEKLYPLIYFERNMCDFIQMLLEDMDIPALDKVIIFVQFECATSCELTIDE